MTTHPDYQILVTNPKGVVRQVQRRDRRKFPAKDGRVFTVKSKQGFHPKPHWHFTLAEANQIKAHFQHLHMRVEVSRGRKYPWLICTGHWPVGASGNDLLRRANAAARDAGRRLKIISGRRTEAEAARLWDGWVHRRPGYNLAARCCPCTSMHCVNKAIDCGWIISKGNYLSAGSWPKGRSLLQKHGLYEAVGHDREPWHWQVR